MGLSVSFDHTPFQMKLNTKNTKNILWLSFMFCLAATVFYIVVYETRKKSFQIILPSGDALRFVLVKYKSPSPPLRAEGSKK